MPSLDLKSMPALDLKPAHADRPARRPNYVSDRLDWYPGETFKPQVSYREALPSDAMQLCSLAHKSGHRMTRKEVSRLLNDNMSICWLAVRNARFAIGYACGRVTPSGVKMRDVYVSPQYRNAGYESQLLLLCGLELPEGKQSFTAPYPPSDYHAQTFAEWDSYIDDDSVTYARSLRTDSPGK